MFVTASELDIEVGLFNCPGWSQSGGPWVKPSQSMRYLGYAKDTLTGPSKFMGRLPEVGPDARDVRILAYSLVGRTSFRTLGLVPESRTVFFKSDSEEHIRAHFDNYIGKILERIPADHRKTFKVIVEDSYETGGMVMIGPAPEKSPSMENYPHADNRVRDMAAEMWQRQERTFASWVPYGNGRIYENASIEQVMKDMGRIADFVADDPKLPLQFIHLTGEDAEVYFVSNQGDKTLSFDGMFRVSGKAPELWNPPTKVTRDLPQYSPLTDGVKVPLELQPYESSFIVFRKDMPMARPSGVNFPGKEVVASIDSPWTVSFLEGRGGPGKTLTFDKLTDWTENEDYHVRYFSGTATYSNTFKLRKIPESPVYVDLGKVMVMAKVKVKVNGKYTGGVWTAPYRLDISDFVKKGVNTIEVEVVNCWRNRLIGEKSLPESERFTFQTTTYLDKDSELQSSGLLGPVEIQAYDYSDK